MSKTIAAAALIVLQSLAVAGCDKADKAGSGGASPGAAASGAAAATAAAAAKMTCNSIKKNSKCAEYSGDALELGQTMCQAFDGVWSADACPSGGFATCTKPGKTNNYYKGKGAEIELDADSAKLDCDLIEGKFAAATPPPAAPAGTPTAATAARAAAATPAKKKPK